MIEQIVVGFADVETARSAVSQAASLAGQLGAKLHVVTALEDDDVVSVEVGSDRWELSDTERAETIIRNFMSGLPERVDYTVGIAEGDAADVLIREATRLDADVIVVGNVRMQGLGRALGSVGNAVAHHAPCSVLIVKTV